MSAVGDRFSTWDAAYVLGALSPEDRREFEDHLAGCADCQLAIAEVAGIPGLLASVSPEDAAAFSEASAVENPPETLLPDLLGHVRNRRRRIVTALVGIAAALVLLLGGVGIGRALPDGSGGSTFPRRVAFSPVVPSSITAVADVVPVGDGTQIRLECQYADVAGSGTGGAYAEYSVYVVDGSGQALDLKDWNAKPNKVMRPGGTTKLNVSQIDRLEVRQTDTGQTLLQASLH
jgi:hypothetical protein